MQSYSQDAEIQSLLEKIATGDTSVQEFTVHDGLIKKGGKIWLGSDTTLKRTILRSVHDSAVGGHSGVRATYHRMHRNFAWKGMKKDVEEYIAQCNVCK